MAFFGEPRAVQAQKRRSFAASFGALTESICAPRQRQQQKSIICFLGPFLIARKRFEEMRMSSFFFVLFFLCDSE